ncbi:oxygenase MpaB family protein [Acidovorax sp.]|uniref:oxygenase MpaB family protein n=1 Tax=Acidovorax sp. TaxID=1872122 RepID=UPI003918C0BA
MTPNHRTSPTAVSGAAPSDRELAAMQLHADPLADRTINTLLATDDEPQWDALDTVSVLFTQWTDNATLAQWKAVPGPVQAEIGGKTVDGVVTTAMADALNIYVQQTQVLPPWADARKIERAEKIFMEHGALSCILLFCASLPECYVVPDLSSVLHTSGQLEQNAEYRIRSTAAMIFPVMMHGGLTQRGAGVAQVLKVRLIHATIRHLILRGDPEDTVGQLQAGGDGHVPPHATAMSSGRQALYKALYARGWNVKDKGLPCNQEELAYTLLTFGYVFLRSMRRLGIALPRADEEAYLHAWNVVGHILGIEKSLMVDTMADGERLMARMQARGRAEPVTPDPRPALGRALMQTMENSLPWAVVKPFPELMTRYLCGRATANDLGLTRPVPWLSALLFWGVLLLARAVDAMVRLLLPRFSIVRALTRVLGYHFMSRVLMSQTRPLQLPTELLNQVDEVVHGWSDDPHAPRWLNRLEDRLTTHGSWSRDLAGHAQAAQARAAHAQAPHASQPSPSP